MKTIAHSRHLAAAAAAAVLALAGLGVGAAPAKAFTVVDVNSCMRWTNGTTPSQILVNFPLAYADVTPGTTVYYMLNRYTSSGWRYTGVWQSLTAQPDPFSSAGVKWVYQSGYALVGNTVTFRFPANSGWYHVSTQVVVGGVASAVASISPYYNWVNADGTGWTSSCQS